MKLSLTTTCFVLCLRSCCTHYTIEHSQMRSFVANDYTNPNLNVISDDEDYKKYNRFDKLSRNHVFNKMNTPTEKKWRDYKKAIMRREEESNKLIQSMRSNIVGMNRNSNVARQHFKMDNKLDKNKNKTSSISKKYNSTTKMGKKHIAKKEKSKLPRSRRSTQNSSVLEIESAEMRFDWSRLRGQGVGCAMFVSRDLRHLVAQSTLVGPCGQFSASGLEPGLQYIAGAVIINEHETLMSPVVQGRSEHYSVSTPRIVNDKEAEAYLNLHKAGTTKQAGSLELSSSSVVLHVDGNRASNCVLEVAQFDSRLSLPEYLVQLTPGTSSIKLTHLRVSNMLKLTVKKMVNGRPTIVAGYNLFTGEITSPAKDLRQGGSEAHFQRNKTSQLNDIAQGDKNDLSARQSVRCYVDDERPFTGFPCRNSDVCVPLSWVCDGDEDCVDGDDEFECDVRPGNNLSGQDQRCRRHEFRCFSRGEFVCLPNSWLCDGRTDCHSGWDEEPENCYSRPDLGSGVDRCEPGYFRCAMGRGCVAPKFLCDGEDDCRDGSDEWNCRSNNRCDSRYEFSCYNSNRGGINNRHCIPRTWVCDQQEDCDNGEDEEYQYCESIHYLSGKVLGKS